MGGGVAVQQHWVNVSDPLQTVIIRPSNDIAIVSACQYLPSFQNIKRTRTLMHRNRLTRFCKDNLKKKLVIFTSITRVIVLPSREKLSTPNYHRTAANVIAEVLLHLL